MFLDKFISEAKVYEENKNSNKWEPTSLKNRQKEHQSEIDNFEFKLIGTLKELVLALEGFSKKVMAANSGIFNNEVFNEIISMNTNGKMDGLLEKLQLLIKYLNIGEDEKYRFDDIEFRDRKLNKLGKKIKEVSEKTISTLEVLLTDLQEKNTNIVKL